MFDMEDRFMAGWSSEFFVFRDGEGQQYVSAALPTGTIIPDSALMRYRATGPHMPLSWPDPTAVDNAAVWIAEREKEGFTFVPVEG